MHLLSCESEMTTSLSRWSTKQSLAAPGPGNSSQALDLQEALQEQLSGRMAGSHRESKNSCCLECRLFDGKNCL